MHMLTPELGTDELTLRFYGYNSCHISDHVQLFVTERCNGWLLASKYCQNIWIMLTELQKEGNWERDFFYLAAELISKNVGKSQKILTEWFWRKVNSSQFGVGHPSKTVYSNPSFQIGVERVWITSSKISPKGRDLGPCFISFVWHCMKIYIHEKWIPLTFESKCLAKKWLKSRIENEKHYWCT